MKLPKEAAKILIKEIEVGIEAAMKKPGQEVLATTILHSTAGRFTVTHTIVQEKSILGFLDIDE